MQITVDVALYRVNKTLTPAQMDQLEKFLSERWKCSVKLGLIQTVAFDLVATKDAIRDHEINKNNIERVLATSQVLVIGSGMPLHALKPMVEALRGLDVRPVPYEVFSVVENYKSEFQRFSHMNLYKRDA